MILCNVQLLYNLRRKKKRKIFLFKYYTGKNNSIKQKSCTNSIDFYCRPSLESQKHNLECQEGNHIFILPGKIKAATPQGVNLFASIWKWWNGGCVRLYSADKNVTPVIAMQVLKYMPNKTINYISHALGINCVSS